MPVRTPSDAENAFVAELGLYDKVVHETMLVSLNQHGIKTDGRGLRATRIFTRQTVTAITLKNVLPRPSVEDDGEGELWDIGSIASMSRNLIEGYISLYYFGLEEVCPEEAELRFFLLQLHRNVEWYEIRKLQNPQDPGLIEFEEGIPELRRRVKEHPFLASLSEVQRNRALRGLEMYKTKSDFEAELQVCNGLRRDYRYLSNLVHPLPFSVERMDNEKGRGRGTDPDILHCILCLILARSYLAASTVGFADRFPDQLANKFKKEIDAIRPLMSVQYTAEKSAES